jgi:hypothetical protein
MSEKRQVSEKIYACLWHLYPSHFRDAYRDAALQLFRDRRRHERGFFPSLRLWLDLLADWMVSVLRERDYLRPALVGASGAQQVDGTPSFHVLEGDAPRPRALLFGGLLSLLTLATVPMFISHFGNATPTWTAFLEASGVTAPHEPDRPDGTKVTKQAVPRPNLNAADRARVINGVIANLRNDYVYPDIARKMVDALLASEKRGDYDTLPYGAALADALTMQLRDLSHDKHLRVIYSRTATPDDPRRRPPPEIIARYRKDMQDQNCTFEKIQILPHNIGYLKLNAFPDPSICQATATSAMATLNHANAIIFDLRDNHGGSPRMVALMATFLFDHATHLTDLYNRPENSTEQSWTLPPIPGNKLADKPAFVLTSASTFSGGEEFCYDLKMLKRATLVGETTAGGAHLTALHRIDDHFSIDVPFGRPINPISKTDWEGTGVAPDVKVNAADALATAENLARNQLGK